MLDCPDLAGPPEVMQHVVNVESSRNPFAIGVVGGYLARQPANLEEALAAVRQLKEEGYNFSVGIAQVNRYNLSKYGLPDYASAFQACPNLKAGSRILRECYDRAQDWGKAFSCYYSGNFVTGFDHGYVQKIFASIRRAQYAVQDAPKAVRIIPYTSKSVRKIARDDSVPLEGKGGSGLVPIRPSHIPVESPYPEPYAVRRYLPSTPLAVSATAMAHASKSASGMPMSTAEVRSAIPVPGPGAQTPEAKTPDALGAPRIPLQVVGVGGDPYNTEMVNTASRALAMNSLPLPDAGAVPLAVTSGRSNVKNGISEHVMNARKGGELLQPREVKSTADKLPTKASGSAGEWTEPNVGNPNDKSFVF